jgi:hypothetical protein
VFNFTLPLDPQQPAESADVLSFYSNMQQDTLSDPSAHGFTVTDGPGAGSTVNITPGAAPPRGATSDNFAGEPDLATSPLSLPPGATPWHTLQANLAAALTEAKAGKWDNSGRQSKNVYQCFQELGRSNTFSNAWCAAFVNTMLKRSGISYMLNDLFALSFQTKHWGQAVSLTDYSSWRPNDVIVFKYHHVAFLKGINTADGRIEYIGGNQGGSSTDNGNLTQVRSKAGGVNSVVYIARGWEVPPEIDKSMF